MKIFRYFAIVAMTIGACVVPMSCSSGDDPDNPGDNKEIKDPTSDPRKKIFLDERQTQMVKAQTEASLKLLSHINEPGINKCLSPVSIEICLGMLTNGAVDKTRQSLLDLFGAKDVNELNSFNRLIYTHLAEANPSKVKFESKQAFWGNNLFNVKPEYARLLEKEYDASTFLLDFPQTGMKDIVNKWIDENTHGLIPNFLPKEIDPLKCAFVLANTIYFKGEWNTQFDVSDNTVEPFNAGTAGEQKVTMMNRVGSFYYSEGDNFEAFSLPYGQYGDFAIHFIVPDEGISLDDFLANMTVKDINTAIECEQAYGKISIPKFEIETFNILDNPLRGAGLMLDMKDFTTITDKLQDINVLHGTHVIVNESGTEAAAVTLTGYLTMIPTIAKDFKIDRPFIFFIKEHCTRALLFIGKVSEIK